MAITKTTKVSIIEVTPAIDKTAGATKNAKWPTATVRFRDTIDDSSDADLPVYVDRLKNLSKFVKDDGAATDYSSEDDLVKAVLAAIWT